MICKWMGGWSIADLDEVSPETRAEILVMIEEEQEAIEAARAG